VAAQLQAQQIQVGAALVWGEGHANDSAFFTGRDHPLSTPSFVLHYDMEVSRYGAARTGHLLLLGLDSLAFSADVFHLPNSGVPVVDWARRQPRAVVGMAHGQYWPAAGGLPAPPGGCCVPWEVVVDAARGRLDFLSAERMPDEEPGTFLQNAGLRVAIAGGSDWSCLSERFHERTPRTDAIVDGALTYEGWLSALKGGRTVMAAGVGNRLNLRVEGRRLGEEVTLAGPQEVTITIETAGAASDVDVLVNGERVTGVPMAAGFQVSQTRVAVSRSSWICARSRHALTSPVYVLVAGQPVRGASADVCHLLQSVQELQDLVGSGRINVYESREAALAAYREAEAELRRRLAETGGSCGA
jgi:hypothetical protein